jgi:hypothetical protein
MDDVRNRRLFALLGGVMTGAGLGIGADILASPENPGTSPVLAFMLAGLGLGVMLSASLRD